METNEVIIPVTPVYQSITRVEALVSSGSDYLVVVSDAIAFVYALHGISHQELSQMAPEAVHDLPGLNLLQTLDRQTDSLITCLCPLDALHVRAAASFLYCLNFCLGLDWVCGWLCGKMEYF